MLVVSSPISSIFSQSNLAEFCLIEFQNSKYHNKPFFWLWYLMKLYQGSCILMPVPVVLISGGTSPLGNIFHFSKIDPVFLFHSISLPSVIYQIFSIHCWNIWMLLMKSETCLMKYFYCYIFQRCHLFKVFTTSKQIVIIQIIPYLSNCDRILFCVTA